LLLVFDVGMVVCDVFFQRACLFRVAGWVVSCHAFYVVQKFVVVFC